MTYVGIDNGLDGGIAFLQDGVLELHTMPTESNGKSRRVDVEQLSLLLHNRDINAVLYESVSGSKNVKAAVSMADSFARVETVLKFLGYRHQPLTARTWQKQFWTVPKMAKGVKFDTKAAALRVAKQLWPTQDWRKNERCKVAHDGIVDAALIAEYARRVGV